jgi:hypothetical protein
MLLHGAECSGQIQGLTESDFVLAAKIDREYFDYLKQART